MCLCTAIIEDVSNKKIADFETAITAAEIGKFQYLLSLAIIPASWASSIDTSNMSVILASAECDLGLSLFDKGLLNSSIYFGEWKRDVAQIEQPPFSLKKKRRQLIDTSVININNITK